MFSKITENFKNNYYVGNGNNLPESGHLGDIFYNIDTNTLYMYVNSYKKWLPMCDSSNYKESESITTIKNDITTIKNNNCPNCGAPIKVSYKGLINCAYCNSLIKIS